MTIVEKIIEKYSIPNIVKSRRGNSPEISGHALVDSIVTTHSIKEAAKVLGIGYQTLNRLIYKYIKQEDAISLNGGNETWKYIVLKSVQHKYCSQCNTIKPYCLFNKDNTRPDKLFRVCKKCRVITNSLMYGTRKLRIPKWADLEAIADFYENCPEGMHVDHIIPLQGEIVSGLHVLNNLQYLSALDNIRKGNKYSGDW